MLAAFSANVSDKIVALLYCVVNLIFLQIFCKFLYI